MIRLFGILVLILAVILFPPAVLAVISNNAIPGDRTYPIKRSLEAGILTIASVTPTTKAWFTINRSNRRFQESVTLITAINKNKKAVATLNELVIQTKIAADEIKKLDNKDEKKKLTAKLKDSIENYQQELSKIKQNLESTVAQIPTSTATPAPARQSPSPTPTPRPLAPQRTPRPTPIPTPPPTSGQATPTLTPQSTPSPSPGSPSITPQTCEGELDPVLGCIISRIGEIGGGLEEPDMPDLSQGDTLPPDPDVNGNGEGGSEVAGPVICAESGSGVKTDPITGEYICTYLSEEAVSPTPEPTVEPTPNIISPGSFRRNPDITPSPTPHDNSEVIIQNSPPGASVTGPTNGSVFKATAFDNNSNLSEGQIWVIKADGTLPSNCPSGIIAGNSCLIIKSSLSGSLGSFLESWSTTEAGTYLIFVQAFDSEGNKCSAAYESLGTDWSDCGSNDYLIFNVN